MARWLLDCRPLCGKHWLLGLATEPGEREEVYRLRYDIFFRECGYGPGSARDGLDRDAFDDWCDHLILWDSEHNRVVGTYRAILGAEAMRRGGLYAADEFDFSPLVPIADRILQGGRTCVAAGYRTGPAFQYLSYGMELLLREYGCLYFLGAESFRATDPDALNRIHSYLRRYGSDPDWVVEPRPACRVPGLREVPVSASDERHLPALIRADLRLGFLACSPPASDPDFGCYDVLVLGRRDRLTPAYHRFIDRIERRRPDSRPSPPDPGG